MTDVVGRTAQAARAELKDSGCTNIVVKMCATRSMTFGHVVKVQPIPGRYPSASRVTIWRVVRPATGVAACTTGETSEASGRFDGLYTYTASKGTRTCTTTYTTGQAPKTTAADASPFTVGTPGFMIIDDAFASAGILEGTVNSNGQATVVTDFGYPFFDPPGLVQFTTSATGRTTATGSFAATGLVLSEEVTSRTVCDMKYWFTADRTDGPDR